MFYKKLQEKNKQKEKETKRGMSIRDIWFAADEL